MTRQSEMKTAINILLEVEDVVRLIERSYDEGDFERCDDLIGLAKSYATHAYNLAKLSKLCAYADEEG